MSVLRVKDKDGNTIDIPSIKGQRGDNGLSIFSSSSTLSDFINKTEFNLMSPEVEIPNGRTIQVGDFVLHSITSNLYIVKSVINDSEITVSLGSYINICNNIFRTTIGVRSDVPVKFANISNNQFIACSEGGVRIAGAVDTQITGNMFETIGAWTSVEDKDGIILTNCKRTVVANNRFFNKVAGHYSQYGIKEAGTTDATLVIGNTFQDMVIAPYLLIGESSKASDNVVNSVSVGSLELLETITVAEAESDDGVGNISVLSTSSIERTYSPLSAVKAIINTAVGDSSVNTEFAAYGVGKTNEDEIVIGNAVFANGIHTAARKFSVKLAKEKCGWYGTAVASGATSTYVNGASNGQEMSRASFVNMYEYPEITKILFTTKDGTVTIPVGTVIEVWGVKTFGGEI